MENLQIRLEGKAVVVTGAGKGIGREICKLLAKCGAKVAAISRTKEDLDSLAAEIPCQPIVADLADANQCIAAGEEALKRLGRIDCLVNNAGISVPQSFLTTTVEAFDRTIAVNVRAVLLLSQISAKDMIARGRGGAIVNLSSQASSRGIADHAAYCASKGALDQLTRTMALELGPHQIRVNAINPTVTLTPMGEMAWGDPKKSGPMLARIPLGRFAKPYHVANAVAYLLSDAADMIHGVTLPVDGGFLAV
jgi:NAD(P)-dependent dehydrogenase (short-subunit alcohol dehydrogenase family)